MVVKICRTGDSGPVKLAARELKKYLSLIDPSNEYALLSFEGFDPDVRGALWVGQDASFPLPAVSSPALDDGISVNVRGLEGYISGTNSRAVLIAAYRFLRELGCSFIRPGADGERVPRRRLSDASVSVCEAPSYRHRAVCIEGSVRGEDVTDLIEWMPKVGLNGFYTQFRVPKTFYERFYSNLPRGELKAPFTSKDALGLANDSIAVLKERGLLHHAVGHGWTCEPFGIEGTGWDRYNGRIPEETKRFFAQIGGKRELWGGVPLNTNLCYSSEEVREKMASAVAEYAASHPGTDYIHVWLADGKNNFCECENCRKKRPSDFYVQILNKIGKKLDEINSPAKIVFLIYVDLLWEPLEERLCDPDRFVLMFAPITRSYSSGISQSLDYHGKLADYKRNENAMPLSVAENIARLRRWQENFRCDSFDFDYHYMWDEYKDLAGGMSTARVMFDDMKNLDKIGLNGMVSCQCVRAFFPHGLGMNGMAAALWDKNADFESFSDGYFSAAFGEDGALVKEYVTELSRLSSPEYMRGETAAVMPDLVPRLEKAKKTVCDFEPVIARNLGSGDRTVALSYFYLSRHGELAKLFLDLEIALASGDAKSAGEKAAAAADLSAKHESELRRVFDHYLFSRLIVSMTKDLAERIERQG